jgi:UDP-glucose 4-epimerase
MTRIAVTGGGGFIGKAVIERALTLNHEAWRFDRSDGDDILGNLEGLAGAEVIIHLAGMLGTSELFDDAEAAVQANVTGTLRILEWCRDTGAGYVGITMPDSSWANMYQATKLCAMRIATAWHRNFDVPVSHVRAFNAYGPGQKHGLGHPQKIIPTFAYHAWRGEKIPVWGNGLQTVDLVGASDIARMLVNATDFGDDEIFDAGTGSSVTVREVAQFVNRTCHCPEDNIEYLPMRLGEEPDTDIRATGEGWAKLGWRPTFSWARLRETVEWYRPKEK